jgi:ribonucleoside-triphosphate reductase
MDSDNLTQENTQRATISEADELEMLVRRSDEDVAIFDSQRIAEALVREAELDPDLAVHISLEIKQFIQKLGFRSLSSSLIRGLVDAKLLEMGLEDAHRAHTRLGVPLYDVDRIIRSSFRDSASHPFGPEGTSMVLAEAIKREYAISSVFSEPIGNAHSVGDIHIHAIGAIDRPHSVISTVDYLKRFGIALPRGFASSRPAKRAEVLIAHLIKFSASLQGFLSGAVVWDSLNFAIAPFLTDLSDEAVKQLAQTLVFEFSAPAVARGGQVIAADLHLDWDAPAYLKARTAVGAGGQDVAKTYGDFTGEAQRFLQALLEVYLEGDGSGNAFLTPRLILHINQHFNELLGYRGILELASRLGVERGGITIAFDRDENGAFYRRYGIADERGVERADHHALRAIEFQNISLNLPRVGYLAADNHLRVFEELTRLMETAAQAHLEKRVFLEKLLAMGERGPLAGLAIKTSGSPFLKLNWSTHAISIIGLNELCRAVLGAELHESSEALEFALKVLTHLQRETERLSNKHKVRFVLSAQNNDIGVHRLARLDLRFFGDVAAKVVCGDVDTGGVYYTDGARLSSASKLSVLERIRLEGLFHEFGFVNAATEIWLGESVPTSEGMALMISQAFYQTNCAGVIFCPEFSICSRCGHTWRGLHDICPNCNSNKVEGLAFSGDRYGITASWDAGQLEELKARKRMEPSEL